MIGVAQRRPAHPENDSDRHRACSADEITVTFSTDAAADAGNDSIVIGQTTAIQIRPDNQTPTTGQIFRPTTGGGDATITGITTTNNADGSGGTNFGSLSSSNGALANFNVVLDPVNVKTAGTAFNIDITARDQFNNTVGGTNGGPDFNGAGNTVDLTSNVAIGAGGGTTGTFTNGVLNNHSVTLTGTNNGGTTITATDTAGGLGTGAETGTTPAFTVQPGALNNFLVELGTGGAIGTQTAGAAFNIDVTARDANNNTLAFDTNIYTGTPTLTSTVAIGAGGGATGAFVAGVLDNHSITLTGTNNGGATITATDGVATASAAFTVQPGALANFLVVLDPVATKTAGTAFNIDVTARDANSNTLAFGTNDFNGAGNTVDITSNVAIGAGGGTTGTFTNGVLNNHSVTLTGTNNGGATITATDTAGGLGTGAETGVTPAFTVQPGALAAGNVTPASLAAGAQGNVTVTFQVANPWATNGRVVIVLPGGYTTDVASAVASPAGNLGAATFTVAGGGTSTLTLTRQGDGNALTAGQTATFEITLITNPEVTGDPGNVTITTQTSGSVDIDASAFNAAGDTITAGALTAANVTPADTTAGVQGNVTVTFQVANPWGTNGKVVIVLPAGYTTDVASAVANPAGNLGAATFTVAGGGTSTLTLTRQGDGNALTAGQTATFEITLITNPTTTGDPGNVTVTTQTNGSVDIDAATFNPVGDPITPGAAATATSLISASPTSITANGASKSTITVQLRDANNNNLTTGGDTVGLATDLGAIGAVTDNGDGTYTATLSAGLSPGTATVAGTVNGPAITDNATVTFAAPPPLPAPPAPAPKPKPAPETDVPPDVTLADPVVEQTLDTTTDTTTDEEGNTVLTASSADGSLSVTVPLDSLDASVSSIDVSVKPVEDTTALTDAVAAPQGTLIVAGQAYDIDITDDQGTALTQFSAPLTLTFTVDPLVTDPADVVVFLYDAATGEWVLVDPSLVTASVDGTITVSIDHLTLFALFVDMEAPVLTPPADITLATETPAESVPIDHPDIAAFLAGASAEDALDGPVVVTNGAPSEFPIGSTTVAFFTTDGAGNTATAVATVTVVSGELGVPLAFQSLLPQGDFRGWLGDGGIAVADATAGLEEQIRIVWLWDGARWLSYVPGLPTQITTNFTLQFGSVLFVVGA